MLQLIKLKCCEEQYPNDSFNIAENFITKSNIIIHIISFQLVCRFLNYPKHLFCRFSLILKEEPFIVKSKEPSKCLINLINRMVFLVDLRLDLPVYSLLCFIINDFTLLALLLKLLLVNFACFEVKFQVPKYK